MNRPSLSAPGFRWIELEEEIVPVSREDDETISAVCFVSLIIEAGGDICAVGDPHFVIASYPPSEQVDQRVHQIITKFGPYAWLKTAIIGHLRARGRFIEPTDTYNHWSERTLHPQASISDEGKGRPSPSDSKQ